MSEHEVLDESWMRDVQRRVIDARLDKVKFDNLLENVWGICLKRPVIDLDDSYGNEELIDPVVVRLGANGVRNAFELLSTPVHPDRHPYTDKDYEPDASQFYMGYDSPLRRPQVFGDGPDIKVLRQIEEFGEAMLAEAWMMLGTDAGQKIETLRSAVDDQSQMDVLLWLHDRLRALKSRQLSLTTEDVQGFYHPARLSPKLCGQFPNNVFEPSCLGLSVIAASFIERAGLTHMHAGAMRTHHGEMLRAYDAALFAAAFNPSFNFSEFINDELASRVDGVQNSYRDRGFHAVSLVKLIGGGWFCLDPNFDLSYAISQPLHIAKLSKAYEELTEPSLQGLPVEKAVWLPQGSVAHMIAEVCASSRFTFDVSRLREILLDNDPESLAQRICEVILNSVELDATEFNPRHTEALVSLFEYFKTGETDYPQIESELAVSLRNNVHDYVLWGMDPQEFINRCNSDPHFLVRRLDDIENALYLAVADIAGYEADRYAKDTDSYLALRGVDSMFHEVLECGLPAQRVGAAVLSDFDAYTCPEDQLSPSFWLTHWSSQVPITETRGRLVGNEAQQRRLINALSLLRDSLSYSHQNAIILEYLRNAQVNDEQE